MVFVILPAFNEEMTITVVCQSLEKVLKNANLKYQLIVVDDGSTDGTLKVVNSLKLPNLLIFKHSKNLGLAVAITTGFNEVLGKAKQQDIVVTMDADNTHPANLIPKMVEEINRGSDIVIASRFVKGAKTLGTPFLREIFSATSGLLFRLFLPVKGVKDYTSGFRTYRAKILKQGFKVFGKNFISQPGFSATCDILLKLRKFHPEIAEVPLVLRYDRKIGGSKMKVGETIFETLLLLAKRRLGFYS